nr:PD-(D/E)XK nuclease family protein [uncultured Fusobacterium sp.]
MRPNICKFTTSELSQDAFICYVLEYYKDIFKEKHPFENKFAKFFVGKILKKIGLEDFKINTLEVKKQFMAIDILVIINNSIYVIIEDKIFTSERKNQMNEYREKVINFYKTHESKVYCIYYKTGDESSENIALIQKEKNTVTILRNEIINIFDKYDGVNIIFQDYLSNLKDIQAEREFFKSKDLRESSFTWQEVIGFYNELDKTFVTLKEKGLMPKDIKFNWEEVSNPKGGFICYFFSNVLDFEEYGYYLQLESTSIQEKNIQENLKLVVKVWSDKKDISLLYSGLDILKENYGEAIIKPVKFSRGSWMTQAIIKDYLVFNDIGNINVYETAKNIVRYIKSLRLLKEKLRNLS